MNAAAATKAVARLAPEIDTSKRQLAAVVSLLGSMPKQCREKVLVALSKDDSRGVAILKLDRALAQANATILECARWSATRDAAIRRAAQ